MALRGLKDDYQNDNVVFVEQDVDAPLADRVDRWFDGHGIPGTVYLPLAMVDSGFDVSSGSGDFTGVYSHMVDNSLQRPPRAQMTVTGDRIGTLLEFSVRLTNTSGVILSAANNATLTALIYQEPVNASVVPLVTKAGTSPITTLADGASGDYTFRVEAGDLDPARTRWIVIADYQTDGSGSPYDTLQAVRGP